MFEKLLLKTNGITMHVRCAGPQQGPLLVLLHGFPEFWYGWREYIQFFAKAGFRVVAPDQRGYGETDKPEGVEAYRIDVLANDIFGLADALGYQKFCIAGHDWGASVAWWMATRNGSRIERMAILNAPHPAVWMNEMQRDPRQRKLSRYVRLLRVRAVPELLIRAGRFRGLAKAFEQSTRALQAFTPEIMGAYYEAWRRPSALTAMLNWYRALFKQAFALPMLGSIRTPTLILWGDRDAFAIPELAERSAVLCNNAIVRHFPKATHWLQHDIPNLMHQELLGFFAPVIHRQGASSALQGRSAFKFWNESTKP